LTRDCESIVEQRLPQAEVALVEEHKLTGYLLSASHPTGRAKAQFFNGFGFKLEAWEILRDELLRHARENCMTAGEVNAFGAKYLVDGPLLSPDGRNPRVRAIWFVEAGDTRPRLVTAYPLGNQT